jgi:hypothetical protein
MNEISFKKIISTQKKKRISTCIHKISKIEKSLINLNQALSIL